MELLQLTGPALCGCNAVTWCDACEKRFASEPKRPRAVILAELREIVTAHVSPSLLPWALEKQDELESKEP